MGLKGHTLILFLSHFQYSLQNIITFQCYSHCHVFYNTFYLNKERTYKSSKYVLLSLLRVDHSSTLT